MRQIIEIYQQQGPTQGAIFSCLESSAGSSCHGVIITARCDLEHQKLDKIVSLPVYKIDEWMILYGNDEIYFQAENSVTNQFDAYFRKYNIDFEIYKKFGYIETLRVIKEHGVKQTDIDFFEKCSSYFDRKDLKCGLKSVAEFNKKYLESLLSNSKANLHFLEGLLGDNSQGFVIDLGEPISIPMKAINDISAVLFSQKFNRYKDSLYKNMNVDEGSSAKFTSIILSPYIEHLLQRFSQFYSRIGTEDIHPDTSDIIKEIYENR